MKTIAMKTIVMKTVVIKTFVTKTMFQSGSIRQALGVAALAILPISATLQAESVAVPVGSQAADMQSVERPMRGETQNSVAQRFGQPAQSEAPIGKPPITKWVYDNFTVYFEYDRVIHTVLRHHK